MPGWRKLRGKIDGAKMGTCCMCVFSAKCVVFVGRLSLKGELVLLLLLWWCVLPFVCVNKDTYSTLSFVVVLLAFFVRSTKTPTLGIHLPKICPHFCNGRLPKYVVGKRQTNCVWASAEHTDIFDACSFTFTEDHAFVQLPTILRLFPEGTASAGSLAITIILHERTSTRGQNFLNPPKATTHTSTLYNVDSIN